MVMVIAPVAPATWVISGYSNGNILVVGGRIGLLLVDGQSARRASLADSALRTVTALPVRLVVNTHYHDDHVEGNPYWRARGARIVAQAMLAQEAARDTTITELEWHRTPAAPEALPDITFVDSLTLDFEGEPVVLLHLPAAHTRTDALIWLPRRNVIHTGDVLEREAPPFIDFWGGGTLEGMIGAIDQVLALADDRTVIVPGHGTVARRADLLPYRAMLIAARERVEPLARTTQPEAAVASARPLREFEEAMGGERRAAEFVRRVVVGLRAVGR
jgi:glyoxylase-like metal-dependent hydrolase (beta-lactamase superfamily II)